MALWIKAGQFLSHFGFHLLLLKSVCLLMWLVCIIELDHAVTCLSVYPNLNEVMDFFMYVKWNASGCEAHI